MTVDKCLKGLRLAMQRIMSENMKTCGVVDLPIKRCASPDALFEAQKLKKYVPLNMYISYFKKLFRDLDPLDH